METAYLEMFETYLSFADSAFLRAAYITMFVGGGVFCVFVIAIGTKTITDWYTHLLKRLQLIDQQMAELNCMIAAAMKPHQDAVIRLAEVPGLGVDSAQQIIAEVSARATTFPSAAKLTSWVGPCPSKEESAEQNHSSRSAKGNKYLRRVLNQAAYAAVAKKGSHFQNRVPTAVLQSSIASPGNTV